MPRSLPIARWCAVALALAACVPPVLREWRGARASPPRTFVVPSREAPDQTAPFFRSEFASPPNHQQMVHVASICESPDRRLCVAWYGGSREAAADVTIQLATRPAGPGGQWSAPHPIASRESAQEELQRPINKVGNAVLFSGADGVLQLLYTSMPFGGWSCCSLNLKMSRDGGASWSRSQRLTLSPLLNFSELVKNKPAALSDGAWAVPIYHEFITSFPELLWLTPRPARGQWTFEKTRVGAGRDALQPALVALNDSEALLLLRDSGPDKRVRVVRTADTGRSWPTRELADLPNPNSGLDAVRLADGRVLLAFNDRTKGRYDLSLAVSADGGQTWARRAVVERETGAEFSYPFLLQSSDRQVHLVYTWRKLRIKHATFNTAWLDAERQP